MSNDQDSKMGRPKIKIDPDTFEALMGIPFVTCEAIADVFKCSISTIVRWIKEEYQITFDEMKRQKHENIKLKLAGKQYETAMKGNVPMQIWLGKQWLDQSDKQEIKSKNIHSFDEVSDEELEQKIKEKEKLVKNGQEE